MRYLTFSSGAAVQIHAGAHVADTPPQCRILPRFTLAIRLETNVSLSSAEKVATNSCLKTFFTFLFLFSRPPVRKEKLKLFFRCVLSVNEKVLPSLEQLVPLFTM